MTPTRALSLVLRRNEGALLRLLGTVQRRGFEIAAVRTHAVAGDGALWRVELDVCEAGRDVGLLARQLRRLVDVVTVGDDEDIETADPTASRA